jgi:site-specific DNA recombinase
MRAAIYARYSTELQSKESIDDQYRACERVAASNGFEIVARYADEAISGGTVERPGYQALLSAARVGSFDVIVAEDISRLWRNRAEFGPRSAELEDLGCQLVTAVGDDTRREGYGLMISLKAAMAEQYRQEVSYRTRRGMEGLARAGKSTGGRLYGYAPGEAATVARVFRDRAAGASVVSLVASLNREGVPGPRSPRWSAMAIRRLLSNPRYKGVYAWGVTQTRTRASDGKHGKPVTRPEGPLSVRQVPALVSAELWDAVNA